MVPKSVFSSIPNMSSFLITLPHTSSPSSFQVPFNLNSHMLLEVFLLLDCHSCRLAYLPSVGNSVFRLNNNSMKSQCSLGVSLCATHCAKHFARVILLHFHRARPIMAPVLETPSNTQFPLLSFPSFPRDVTGQKSESLIMMPTPSLENGCHYLEGSSLRDRNHVMAFGRESKVSMRLWQLV